MAQVDIRHSPRESYLRSPDDDHKVRPVDISVEPDTIEKSRKLIMHRHPVVLGGVPLHRPRPVKDEGDLQVLRTRGLIPWLRARLSMARPVIQIYFIVPGKRLRVYRHRKQL